ncbi:MULTISPECIES: hypothetical protein [unclassified Saccharopolyspora]|uniref:hypothetical protein n=1 Tax=unclassified Saccharopolyspora TaxID=2646250 RepID=UPI001CD5F914|nr:MULTISPECIES: hypothetical protein [unclassified Saccharopolyspora]MCA1185099.1 hypothetical protein [Saccharopolyspora sp. 6T]MCA1224974.1 hypothetical protein [Saccharopolyspora sp. 6M]MCA1278535.1 hypothetical protein [Saccharopolyspora sp. 7B]
MKTRVDRACLVVLLLVGASTGFWAFVAPESWHASFPGFGLDWLPRLGPYNEHLTRDTGAMFLALATLSGAALRRVDDVVLTRAAGAAWLVFNALHFGFHSTMLHMYGLLDQVLSMGSLGLVTGLALVLVLPGRASGQGASR